jgi:hypothetical protein
VPGGATIFDGLAVPANETTAAAACAGELPPPELCAPTAPALGAAKSNAAAASMIAAPAVDLVCAPPDSLTGVLAPAALDLPRVSVAGESAPRMLTWPLVLPPTSAATEVVAAIPETEVPRPAGEPALAWW